MTDFENYPQESTDTAEMKEITYHRFRDEFKSKCRVHFIMVAPAVFKFTGNPVVKNRKGTLGSIYEG